jgi:hypothetical protein
MTVFCRSSGFGAFAHTSSCLLVGHGGVIGGEVWKGMPFTAPKRLLS